MEMLLTGQQTLEYFSVVQPDIKFKWHGLSKRFVIQGGAFAYVLLSGDVWDVSVHREDNCNVECRVV